MPSSLSLSVEVESPDPLALPPSGCCPASLPLLIFVSRSSVEVEEASLPVSGCCPASLSLSVLNNFEEDFLFCW